MLHYGSLFIKGNSDDVLHLTSAGEVEAYPVGFNILSLFLLQMIVVEANGDVLYNKVRTQLPLITGEALVLFSAHTPLISQHFIGFAQMKSLYSM